MLRRIGKRSEKRASGKREIYSLAGCNNYNGWQNSRITALTAAAKRQDYNYYACRLYVSLYSDILVPQYSHSAV